MLTQLDTDMAALTFEKREVLLTLEQRGEERRAPIMQAATTPATLVRLPD